MPETLSQSNSLNELFARDPTTLTDNEVNRMIEAFREARSRWVQEEQRAKAAGKRPNPRAAAPSLKLEDLFP